MIDSATAARLFAALAHETRLTVFRTLARVGELRASDLALQTGLAPSALSFHLKDLRAAGLVETRRDGRYILYSANYGGLSGLRAFLDDDGSTASPPWRGPPQYTVLFLCTGNSARSVMAECLLNRMGGGRFRAHSAGSHPRGRIDPMVLSLLSREGHPTTTLRSKSWDEFTLFDAPEMDFVFTVCDVAAAEPCPTWPGQPTTAHWGVPDPTDHPGDDMERALVTAEVYHMLANRISLFLSLPLDALEDLTLQSKLDGIGRTRDRRIAALP
jgi:arsenate reductase